MYADDDQRAERVLAYDERSASPAKLGRGGDIFDAMVSEYYDRHGEVPSFSQLDAFTGQKALEYVEAQLRRLGYITAELEPE